MFCEGSLKSEAADCKILIDNLRSSLSFNKSPSLESGKIIDIHSEVMMTMPSYMLAGWKTRIDPGDGCGDGD